MTLVFSIVLGVVRSFLSFSLSLFVYKENLSRQFEPIEKLLVSTASSFRQECSSFVHLFSCVRSRYRNRVHGDCFHSAESLVLPPTRNSFFPLIDNSQLSVVYLRIFRHRRVSPRNYSISSSWSIGWVFINRFDLFRWSKWLKLWQRKCAELKTGFESTIVLFLVLCSRPIESTRTTKV